MLLAYPATAPYIDSRFINKKVKKHHLQKFLVVRTDRIGDVILTLPIVEALKDNFEDAQISLLVSSYTSNLIEGIADVVIYDREGTVKPFFEILSELKQAKFDAAIVAYPRFRIALLLWLAGIPIRVGTGYRWYSFLFNRKVFEHRKTVEKHESEYNLSLPQALGCVIPENIAVQLILTDEHRKKALSIRKELGINENDKLILLHPGSGGSARNWKPEKFAQLATELTLHGYKVVITGGKTEFDLVNKVIQKSNEKVKSFISNLSLKEFAAFIQTANLFVANSTGPLHIAAVVGTPVVGFFPPVQVMSPKRWGPLTDKKKIFVPDPKLCMRCKGGLYKGDDCMEQIEVEKVLSAVIEMIEAK